MRNALVLTVMLSMLAAGAQAHSPTGQPETGAFAPHVAGTAEEGRPEIHHPAASSHDSASAGLGTMRGGADDPSVTRLGPGRGNLGFSQGANIVENDEGRPVVEHGHRPPGSR